jgi:hypothetical protein
MGGQTFSVPGRLKSINYRLSGWLSTERESASPRLRLSPDGPEGEGPAGLRSGELTAVVGRALPLTVWTKRSDLVPGDTRPIHLRWVKHQGPGEVTFSPREIEVAADAWRGADGGARTTEAAFSEAGEYVLRVLAFNAVEEFEFHCCWTNGYVRVRVNRSEDESR